ncbi:hypothetical protein ACSHT2_13980 [Bradyrhizobium sp. PUT101]|uniref:hypothetical protein n=1 Tax=Bradyrhizobium sp. PUT101 TaxID=3447427 RepID=UPI003F828E86
MTTNPAARTLHPSPGIVRGFLVREADNGSRMDHQMAYQYLQVVARRPKPVRIYHWLNRQFARLESMVATVEQTRASDIDMVSDMQLATLVTALRSTANHIEAGIKQRAEQRRTAHVRQLDTKNNRPA